MLKWPGGLIKNGTWSSLCLAADVLATTSADSLLNTNWGVLFLEFLCVAIIWYNRSLTTWRNEKWPSRSRVISWILGGYGKGTEFVIIVYRSIQCLQLGNHTDHYIINLWNPGHTYMRSPVFVITVTIMSKPHTLRGREGAVLNTNFDMIFVLDILWRWGMFSFICQTILKMDAKILRHFQS